MSLLPLAVDTKVITGQSAADRAGSRVAPSDTNTIPKMWPRHHTVQTNGRRTTTASKHKRNDPSMQLPSFHLQSNSIDELPDADGALRWSDDTQLTLSPTRSGQGLWQSSRNLLNTDRMALTTGQLFSFLSVDEVAAIENCLLQADREFLRTVFPSVRESLSSIKLHRNDFRTRCNVMEVSQ